MKPLSLYFASLSLFILLNSCGIPEDEHNQIVQGYKDDLSSKQHLITDLYGKVDILDNKIKSETQNFQIKEDSLNTQLQKFNEEIEAQKRQISLLEEKLSLSTDDLAIKEYLRQLSNEKEQLRELLSQQQYIVAELSSEKIRLSAQIERMTGLNSQFSNILMQINSLEERIEWLLESKDIPASIPSDITDKQLELQRAFNTFALVSESAPSTYNTHDELTNLLKTTLDKTQSKISSLEKKIDQKYILIISKQELKRRNLLKRDQLAIENINEGEFNPISTKQTSIVIRTEKSKDKPQVLSEQNQRYISLQQESDYIWNLHISNAELFWLNNKKLVIAY